MITGIVSNPGCEPENIISLQDAIDRQIIDPNRGLYINKSTYASIAISQAMNEGLIKVLLHSKYLYVNITLSFNFKLQFTVYVTCI